MQRLLSSERQCLNLCTMEEVTNRYQRLSLEEEEEEDEEFVVDQEGERDKQPAAKWVLLGCFLTDRPVNSMGMKIH